VGFDVQDLFVQVTVVIHLKSTLPRQTTTGGDDRLLCCGGGVSGWPARSLLCRIASLRDVILASRLSNGSFCFPYFDLKSTCTVRSQLDPKHRSLL
jgi:hypothetical protein